QKKFRNLFGFRVFHPRVARENISGSGSNGDGDEKRSVSMERTEPESFGIHRDAFLGENLRKTLDKGGVGYPISISLHSSPKNLKCPIGPLQPDSSVPRYQKGLMGPMC